MKIGIQAYCGYFQVCEKWSLWPLDSLETWFVSWLVTLDSCQSWCIWSLELLSEMCTIWVFWDPKEVKIMFFGHFQKTFSLVSHHYCFTYSSKVPLGCVEYGPQRPHFWTILGLEMNQNSVVVFIILWKSFLWIHTNLALYVHWSYFHKCV